MNRRPWRKKITRELSITDGELSRLIARAPHTYKTYTIPKNNGGRRTISQPARETKYLQYWLIRNIFSELPVHDVATAYAAGSSIRKNASRHRQSSYLVKLDFQNFFTSIKHGNLVEHVSQYCEGSFDEADISDICRLSCIKYKHADELCLSIGAPCSPLLSNSVMYEFDELVTAWSMSNGFNYTRYADDLTLSTGMKGVSKLVEPEIREIIRGISYPSLRLNNKKTMHLSKASSRRVTGIVLTNEGELSIGRSKKREIRSMIFSYKNGELDAARIASLQGLLGFAMDVERPFISRLKTKYGASTLDEILKYRLEKNQDS